MVVVATTTTTTTTTTTATATMAATTTTTTATTTTTTTTTAMTVTTTTTTTTIVVSYLQLWPIELNFHWHNKGITVISASTATIATTTMVRALAECFAIVERWLNALFVGGGDVGGGLAVDADTICCCFCG